MMQNAHLEQAFAAMQSVIRWATQIFHALFWSRRLKHHL